ncbi:hypothetical protein K505DRAFT_375961 [Melanomma pulvis-pyrius CBS 109.77]|uniref:Uncharacterized protein n=1 Tax=Melanomma pulvis-pyrius CBS 109.77 TaxID=1314802 RepID=A0A6A6X8V3_9PLEO|nr:hypothetical protein K505DRAFT_375961 [Melanomma pulvis-pyrius CBS 109.77]
MNYDGSFLLKDTEEMESLPRLNPGLSGAIVWSKNANIEEENSWPFYVVEKGIQPGWSRIALSINRPQSQDSKTGWSERQSETTTIKQLEVMGTSFYPVARSLPTVDVTLFTYDPNMKDLKRGINSIVSTIPSEIDSKQAKLSKEMGMEVIKGRNDQLLPAVKMWSKVNREVLQLANNDESIRAAPRIIPDSKY